MSLDFHRPGGLSLTKEILARCQFQPGDSLLDVGCSQGATVQLLLDMGFHAVGIDRINSGHPHCMQADAHHLPFRDESQSGVFFECSLSCIEDQAAAIQEAWRVLTIGGQLVITDILAQNQINQDDWPMRLFHWSDINPLILSTGFELVWRDDRPQLIRDYYAKMLFEESPNLTSYLEISPEQWRQLQPTYSMAIYQKVAPKPDKIRSWTYQKLGIAEGNQYPLFDLQLESFRQQLTTARNISPFYQTHLANIHPEQVETYSDLLAIPMIDNQILASQGMRLLNVSQSEVARVRSFYTSGSTGEPKRFWFTADELNRTIDFFHSGMQHIAAPGDQVGILMSDGKPDSIADLLSRALSDYGASAVAGGTLDVTEAAELVRNSQCVVGIPAHVYYLSQKYPEFSPKSVLLSADYIPESLVRKIEANWGCPVYRHYGLTETGYGLAVQCSARDNHHFRSSDFLIEIIDPESLEHAAMNRPGEIVISSLRPSAIPLIRYRTGDIGSLRSNCACGDRLPSLGPILGRWDNLQTTPNIHFLDDALYSLPGLWAYQAHYKDGQLFLKVEGPVEERDIREILPFPIQLERVESLMGLPRKQLLRR